MIPAQLAHLQHQPEALSRLIADLTDAQLRQPPLPGKWSIFEQIAHLGRYHQVFSQRLTRIADEYVPHFDRYVADTDPHFAEWLALPLGTLLSHLHRDRAVLIEQLRTYPAETLSRRGVHPVFGPMNMTGWTEFFLLHEAHHLFAIIRLAAPFRLQTG